MMIRWCFICVFTVLTNKVSLQVTVKAVIGGSVVLPCSSTKHDHKLQDTDVHWRNNNDKIVYSIIKGKYSVEGQDPRYENRAETFPSENERGIFPLKLNNLTNADAGEFNCFITHSSQQETVQLIIESLAEKEIKSTKQENLGKETGADSVETSSHTIYTVIAVLSLLIVTIVCFFIMNRKKKN